MLYNVHAPSKTFSIQHKDDEAFADLIGRIGRKADLQRNDSEALKEGVEGGLVYEHKGEKYSLEDDDDFQILLKRCPPSSTEQIILRLSPPSSTPTGTEKEKDGQHHAHFAPAPPTYSKSSIKEKNEQKDKSKSPAATDSPSKPKANGSEKGEHKADKKAESAAAGSKKEDGHVHHKGFDSILKSTSTHIGNNDFAVKSKDYVSQSLLGALGPVAGSKPPTTPARASAQTPSKPSSASIADKYYPSGGLRPTGGSARNVSSASKSNNGGDSPGRFTMDLLKPPKHSSGASKAGSVMSSKSRRSKWGDDDAEPLGVVNQRKWEEFHNNSGVRTVVGKVGKQSNVRMLLKTGYRHVYVSRSFAVKAGLVDPKYWMGGNGYTGLKTLGKIPITVGSKTVSHAAMICEEQNFDVMLGREWMEKMNVKSDPIDQTLLTYMDNGETIPCDIVILKDAQGNKIFVS